MPEQTDSVQSSSDNPVTKDKIRWWKKVRNSFNLNFLNLSKLENDTKHFSLFGKHFGNFAGISFVALCLMLTNTSTPWVAHERQQLEDIYDGTIGHGESKVHGIVVSNQHYLSSVEKQSMDDLLKLIEISVVLDVVESSEIGVSFIADFNVTVGNAISELNHVIKRAVEVNILSVASTKLIGLIARFSENYSANLLQAALWCWLFYLFLKLFHPVSEIPANIQKSAHGVASLTMMLFVLLHLMLPYSIHFSAKVSHFLHNEIKLENSNKLSNIHGSLVSGSVTEKLKHKAESSIHNLKKISSKNIHHKTESLFSYFLWSLVLTLFDMILMPLGILFGMYRLLKHILPQFELTK